MATPAATPSLAPTNKAVAATGGSAFGAAVTTIVIHVLQGFGLTVADDLQAAITTIVTALVTLAAAYFTPPGSAEAVVVTPDGMRSARQTAGAATLPNP